jgi:hypothetical protein
MLEDIMKKTHQDRVDSLISHFWKNGYLTVSRKYGQYLPVPKPVGRYEIDALGRFKKVYVMGIALTENEISDPKLKNKLDYLSSRNTKYSNRRIKLYVGVPKNSAQKVYDIVSLLPKDNQESIKIIITD